MYTTCLKLLAVLYLYLGPKSDFTCTKDTWWGSVFEKNSHLLGKTVPSLWKIIQAVWKCDFLLSVIHFYQDLDGIILVKCDYSAFCILDIMHIEFSHDLIGTSLSQCSLYCYPSSFSERKYSTGSFNMISVVTHQRKNIRFELRHSDFTKCSLKSILQYSSLVLNQKLFLENQ